MKFLIRVVLVPALLAAAACSNVSNLRADADADSKGGKRYDQPDAAAAYWAGLHETDSGKTAAQLNFEAMQAIEAREAQAPTSAPLPNVRIESYGPGNFGGRLRGMVIRPSNSNHMLVGSVSGGIWKSSNGGTSWAPSNDFLPSLAVGSMLIDPDTDARVFVGTGEGFFNIDAAQGLGVFVSNDFGDTWSQLPGTNNSSFLYVNRIARIPGTTKLLVATRSGIWGTDDFTVPVPVWTDRTTSVTESSRGFVDLKLDPSVATPGAHRLYAVHYGSAAATRRVYLSNDDGASFTELNATQGLPADSDLGRIELGIGSDGVVYAAIASTASTTRGLWRSPAGGAAFVKTASNTAFIERQGWYDLIMGVKPGDSATVYAGAVDMYKSSDSGAVITKKTFWNPGVGQFPNDYVHADLHVIAFDPNNAATLFIGCDGGLFKSTDNGETWSSLNNDLRVAQYYGIAAHPNGRGVIGGTQDNGSHLFFGDRALWLEWAGGDGGYSAWDQQQPNYIYGATPNGGLFGSANGGTSAADITLPDTTGAPFITPFTLDANDGNRMLVGTTRVYASSNIRSIAGASFSDLSGVLNGAVSALAYSPHSTSIAYAGTAAGGLYRANTLAAASTWTPIHDATWAGSDVTWIEVDPHDATGNTLYVTLADYATNRVWKSTNGGSSWTSIHAGLPGIPMFSVTVDPVSSDRLWLGSELGLWTTEGNNVGSYLWQRFYFGLAYTRVMQLVWATNDVMWAGTHGRGIYKVTRFPGTASITAVDDSASGCDADGVLDSSESADLVVGVRNHGTQTMFAVSVALSSGSAGLTVSAAPQAYGDIAPGAEVTRNFNASLNGGTQCFASLNLSATISSGASSDVQALTLNPNRDVGSSMLNEGAEDTITAFSTELRVSSQGFARSATQVHSGVSSWFAPNTDGYSDKSLISPPITLSATSSLSFWLRYDLEGDASQYWDGALLEMEIAPGEWVDIGTLSSVPYDGPLFENNTAPGRMAWSGAQTTWRNAVVNLGAFAGNTVRLRWRVVTDTGSANVGFWVDDISVSNISWPRCQTIACGVLFLDGFETGL